MTHSLTTGPIKRRRIVRAFLARHRRYVDFLHISSTDRMNIGFGSSTHHRQGTGGITRNPHQRNGRSASPRLLLGAPRRTPIEVTSPAARTLPSLPDEDHDDSKPANLGTR